jgi:hypothetical protein
VASANAALGGALGSVVDTVNASCVPAGPHDVDGLTADRAPA